MMNDETNAGTAKQRHDVYVVDNWTDKNDGTENAHWMRIGRAFEHKDGKGFNVELKALPTSGKIVIRVHEPKPQAVK